ncbi:unnamed protein product [Tilletia controversa]|uniref:GST N-terminal domain-containing protein n=2 Tax=Tilletia TaxID=13289 RepID=A0A177U8S3_9BASI|nr:hypothetical protein CF336_g4967 [Tilletia laevis]KAE8259072.1 hypothetical protein A4X03_0g4201 [Tilletia caries]CAD6928705.1 unnamed protein product [Tilletia controversa]KAE8199395.1 hypothetical protein CF335_g4183 [Tilletia laevis]CAD6887632.1 unnamed protein product [Tilletia caries]
MSSASPNSTVLLVLYDILPNVHQPQRPYALLPNPWITRLILKSKGIPFVVKPITTTELRAEGPGSFRERFGSTLGPNDRPLIPMIEHNGRLVGDTVTIAHYLDFHFPETPSPYLPELQASQLKENALAHSIAANQATQLRATIAQRHVQLVYEQCTELFDEEQRGWMRSDAKLGMPNAYNLFMSMDRATLLASARIHVAGVFSILSPPSTPRIEGLSPHQDTTDLLLTPPAQQQQQFLSSPTKPGLLDFTVFGWFLLTYTADLPLNHAIWSESSFKAREWLGVYKGGEYALRGDVAKEGHWPGDVPLRGVEEWATRMFALYDNYTRRIVEGEVLEGEPEKL